MNDRLAKLLFYTWSAFECVGICIRVCGNQNHSLSRGVITEGGLFDYVNVRNSGNVCRTGAAWWVFVQETCSRSLAAFGELFVFLFFFVYSIRCTGFPGLFECLCFCHLFFFFFQGYRSRGKGFPVILVQVGKYGPCVGATR